jgi:ABC-type multidrug transport system fused ATPase/permease subunit
MHSPIEEGRALNSEDAKVPSGTPDEKAPTPLVSLRGITKRFPNVVANDSVDLDLFAGEVQALLGENGAGKSTLMKILYGFYGADSGAIRIDGEQVRIRSPLDARKHRIGMVFQSFTLIPAMTVAENIALYLPELPDTTCGSILACRSGGSPSGTSRKSKYSSCWWEGRGCSSSTRPPASWHRTKSKISSGYSPA